MNAGADDEKLNKTPTDTADQPDDKALISAIIGGDQRAYQALVKRYLPKLWRLAMSMLHNEQEAEDAVQEVFLSLWQSIDKWDVDGKAQFSTWIYRVTFNKCIDLKRARKPNVAEEDAPEKAVDPDAYNALLQAEIADKMSALLSKLPENQRAVMQMYYYEELSVNEISAKLSATEQSVRSLLKRGRKNLKDKIQYDQAFQSWEFSDDSGYIRR